MQRRRRQAVSLVLAWLAIRSAPASAQALSHLLPSALQRGTTTIVTCYGQGLAPAKTLWTSFKAEVKPHGPPAADGSLAFAITLPADAPLGVHGARLIGEYGISDPKLLVIDDLPVQVKSPSAGTLESPQKLSLPATVDAVCLPEHADFYSISVAAGQQVAFEVVGNRLGTDVDPIVRILTKEGRELLSRDNDEGLAFDCRFEHVFKDAGEYLIEVRDTRYQGGGHWTYHLRVGDFPTARVAYPSSGRRGRWVTVAFPGKHATDVAPMDLEVPADPAQPMVTLAARGAQGSAWVPFVPDDRDQQLELEPNDTLAEANAFSLPRTLHGRLLEPGDVDCYRFLATKGQAILFRSDTRRIASPADLYVRILDAAGNQMAAADDNGADDAQLRFTAPAEGAYVLAVEDLNRRGGLPFIYRIECTPGPSDFSLRASADQIVVAQGSTVPLMVAADRLGYGGPIEASLKLDGVDPAAVGLALAPASIPGAQAPATVSASPGAPLGVYTLEIRGNATIGDKPVCRSAEFSALVAPKLNNIRSLPPAIVREIPVLVTPRPYFELTARVEAAAVGRFVKTPLVVAAAKDKFFDEEIKVEVDQLPPNVAVAPKPIAKNQRSVTLEIESKPNTPLGQFPVFVSGTSSYRGRAARMYAVVLTLDLQPVFSVKLAAAETKIAPAAKAPVVVKAARLPGYSGPIDVALKNLPQGVTAPKATIPEKQNEVSIELAAAADAPAAAIDNLQAVATASVNGQGESATSPAARLVVAK